MVQPALVNLIDPSAHVLVVGASSRLRERLREALELEGFGVSSVFDGEAALDQVRNTPFHLVITALPPGEGATARFLAEVARLQPQALTLSLGSVSRGHPATLDRRLKPSQLEAIVRLVARALNQRPTEGGPSTHEHARLRTSFNRVLANLWLAYQPIVHADSGQVFGYEALLRCGQAKSTRPTPHVILATAEQLDLLRPLGRCIRRLAAQESSLQGQGTSLFVNLHPADLRDPLLFSAAEALSQIASRVVLEITERSGLHEVNDVAERVAWLRRLGFRIALDDLGAGHSGLAVIAKIEPEVVKLDMSLVQDIHQNSTQRKVVRSMIGLSKELGALVVAEGVESEADRSTLRDLGCDLLQGFLFGQPSRSRTRSDTELLEPEADD